jgi:hypothetical protein
MLDTILLVDYKEDIFDSFELWDFDFMLSGEHVTMPTPLGKTFNFFLSGVFT